MGSNIKVGDMNCYLSKSLSVAENILLAGCLHFNLGNDVKDSSYPNNSTTNPAELCVLLIAWICCHVSFPRHDLPDILPFENKSIFGFVSTETQYDIMPIPY